MRYFATTLATLAALAALSVSAQQKKGGDCACCGAESKPANVAATASFDKSVQKATVLVDRGGYSPSTIKVAKGKPVELSFKLGARPGCGDTLVVDHLGVRRELSASKPYVLKFTPKKAGSIPFTCGMGMFKGTIVVK